MEHVSTSDASFFGHFGRFDETSDLSNLAEIVSQNAKIAGYVTKLERAAKDDEEESAAAGGRESDLPPASELVAEIEQFLRQQRPE